MTSGILVSLETFVSSVALVSSGIFVSLGNVTTLDIEASLDKLMSLARPGVMVCYRTLVS